MVRSQIIICLVSLIHLKASVSPSSVAEIQLGIQKLGTLANVLYVAAHPDDENTRFIAYMANEVLAETTYLSLTRGDGGQNLLGDDLGYKLGIARTHELLAARDIDGGKQFFSRANDFGFSKSAVESIEIWEKDLVMADVVWAIRKLRPDVIITRFSPIPGFTHGHHTAATQLAIEAFDLAADSEQFPEQLQWVRPWQAKRIVWNTSRGFYRSRGVVRIPVGMVTVDVGVYNPTLGMAYSEIAATSRSAHKTQGFGSTAQLGESIEYFEHLRGDPAQKDLLEGVDISWSRLEGGESIGDQVAELQMSFDSSNPQGSVRGLLEISAALERLHDSFWKLRKLDEVQDLIFACIGLDIEWLSSEVEGIPGTRIDGQLAAIHRSDFDVKLRLDVSVEPRTLGFNQLVRLPLSIDIPENAQVSQPYWLREEGGLGSYEVNDQNMIGLPEGISAVAKTVEVIVEGIP